MTGMLIYNVLL